MARYARRCRLRDELATLPHHSPSALFRFSVSSLTRRDDIYQLSFHTDAADDASTRRTAPHLVKAPRAPESLGTRPRSAELPMTRSYTKRRTAQ